MDGSSHGRGWAPGDATGTRLRPEALRPLARPGPLALPRLSGQPVDTAGLDECSEGESTDGSPSEGSWSTNPLTPRDSTGTEVPWTPTGPTPCSRNPTLLRLYEYDSAVALPSSPRHVTDHITTSITTPPLQTPGTTHGLSFCQQRGPRRRCHDNAHQISLLPHAHADVTPRSLLHPTYPRDLSRGSQPLRLKRATEIQNGGPCTRPNDMLPRRFLIGDSPRGKYACQASLAVLVQVASSTYSSATLVAARLFGSKPQSGAAIDQESEPRRGQAPA